jgi:hypothetical protein
MSTLATIIDGELDWADLLFLVAFILFVVVGVIYAVGRSVEGALTSAGLACVALALLVL